MCVLSDDSMYKKVSLFGAVSPQTCDKSEKMFVAEQVHQKQTVKLIENSCVFSVSRKHFSNSIILAENFP